MLPVLVIAAALAVEGPSGDDRLPIKGVSVDQTMPENVTHIEAPPLRGYRTMSLKAAPTATPSIQPKARHR
jgi:hypothetical protein